MGDSVACQDFIAPPYMLSSEATGGEITWSRGEYMTGAQVWQAFRLPGSPPLAHGIFANQPSPLGGNVGSAWRTWLWLNVALARYGVLLHDCFAGPRGVQRQLCLLCRGVKSDAAFVTPTFQLDGRDSNVELGIHTDLDNNWAYFNFALINDRNRPDLRLRARSELLS